MYSKSGMIVLFCVLHFSLFAQTQDLDGDGVPDATDQCCNTPKGISVDKDGRPVGDLDGDCDVDRFDIQMVVKNKTGRGSFIGLCPQHCRESSECSEDEYCKKEMENCNGIGVCSSTNAICLDDINPPVCGCDNRTTISCVATQRGVNIAYEGECLCEQQEDCRCYERCVRPDGRFDGERRCRLFYDILGCMDSEVCGGFHPEEWPCEANVECPPDCEDIVCGRGRVTYANAAAAHLNGTSVLYKGGCSNGCKYNSDCEADEFCDKAFDDCNGWGVCNERPLDCTVEIDWVNGCDCQQYQNPCVAAANGVNVSCRGLYCSN